MFSGVLVSVVSRRPDSSPASTTLGDWVDHLIVCLSRATPTDSNTLMGSLTFGCSRCTVERLCRLSTGWAPTTWKWCCNLHTWPYTWVTWGNPTYRGPFNSGDWAHLVSTSPGAPVACNFRARPARSARSRCTCQLEREDAMDEGLSHYLFLTTPSNRSIYPCFAYIAGKCR